MSATGPTPLSRRHFSFGGAVDPVTAAADPQADTPHALLAITEPTKAETTP